MRLFSVFLLVLSVACGGDDDGDTLPDIKTLFPANNEIGQWVEDTSVGAAGVETATDDNGIVALINGGAGPYLERNYNAFGREFYADGGNNTLELRIWQLTTASVASELYTALLTEGATHQTSTFEDSSLGSQGRVANTGNAWWFNVLDGAHLIEITIENGATPDAASKTAGETFATGVLGKL